MTSQAIRDPLADHLITPQNSALVLIDYQPSQFATVRSMDETLLRKNIVSTVKAVKAFGVPIVHSTVDVASGQQQPTVPELAALLDDSPQLDRTTVNSWEDTEFVQAVRATGRRKLIFCALGVHGRLAGPLGRGGAQRRNQRPRLAQQAELVSDRDRRPDDPAARTADDGRARRSDDHPSTRQPRHLRPPAHCPRKPDHPGSAVPAAREFRGLSVTRLAGRTPSPQPPL
jgi:Isochorismatase family